MAVSFACLIVVLIGCTGNLSSYNQTIVLFAPFEGRYREVGYQALYASQLALDDSGMAIELVAVDIGVTVDSAVDRARAISIHDDVVGVVALGYPVTDERVLLAFEETPVIIPGYWGDIDNDFTFVRIADAIQKSELIVISSARANDIMQLDEDPLFSSVFSLPSFYSTLRDYAVIQIASSARMPDDAFRQRYSELGEFVPEPSLIATQTYDTFLSLFDLLAETGTVSAENLLDEQVPDASIILYELDTATGNLTALDVIVE